MLADFRGFLFCVKSAYLANNVADFVKSSPISERA